MKQLAIVSGKGGTGKTTLCASLVALAKKKIVADCDVETPNLHLLLKQRVLSEKDFQGSKCAHIDSSKCSQCGKCLEVCRFEAIKDFEVDSLKCEGCGACQYFCPQQAIRITEVVTGKTLISETGSAIFSHARLKIGADGSGKLVTEVRKNAVSWGVETGDLEGPVIIDGSPGIGCVVIASITGCDAVLIVSEPTVSGKHDLARVLKLADHFGIEAYVCINKDDINLEMTEEIESFCLSQGIEVIGRIPFDPKVNAALKEGIPVVSFPDSEAAKAIRQIWGRVQGILMKEVSTCTPI